MYLSVLSKNLHSHFDLDEGFLEKMEMDPEFVKKQANPLICQYSNLYSLTPLRMADNNKEPEFSIGSKHYIHSNYYRQLTF